MPLIKICGITSWNDAKAAVDAGADMLGFVCDENSERLILPDVFYEISSRLPARIICVGAFAGHTHPQWRLASAELFARFHQIQYYDDAIWPEVIRENWDMRRKVKAFHLTGDKDLRTIAAFNGLVQNFLLNVHAPAPAGHPHPESYGWSLAREVHQFGKRIYLAGGLTPETVRAAVVNVRPYAVDVTVGVEASPGVKDPAKMAAFVRAVRGEK
ncbi:N-(5'-phosphoribosyl)anthranilate isomerase [Capsulimonas corticalis]|uniref:N-(5'-phosphoribosyl)anthranilate isomerase n=1 Tax=Capsulimonas corticalis TaxID=2219043 RepID=A0A402D2B4_9BACT|nr:phosphoribosylanthranilate isomerase [Capsulimonas corticalis]BDI30013.1 N-(5'-phosphoribosyl)anthranilate isomerase [Capsulimonas corticalis]